jgi:hypothetical protein
LIKINYVNIMQIKDCDNTCVICFENSKITHNCIQCKSCNICIGCISNIQERGIAGQCPVCRKNTPWCNNMPVVIEVKKTNYDISHILVCCLRLFQLIAIISISWCIGFIYAYASNGEVNTDQTHIIVKILLFIILGAIILCMLLSIVTFIGLCAITCLNISSSRL